MTHFALIKHLLIIIQTIQTIQSTVIDMDDILSENLMPTTLLVLENPKRTNETPAILSDARLDGSFNIAMETMGYHRSMMNQYLCRSYVAEQIIEDMTLSRIKRRMDTGTLHKNHNALLQDEGSMNYKDWLSRSATLEDIYRHYNTLENRVDDKEESEDKEDTNEDYDGHVTGYAYQPHVPPKVGNTAAAYNPYQGHNYPYTSVSGSGYGHSGTSGGHTGFGNNGHAGGHNNGHTGGHQPIVVEEVYYQHTKSHDKGHDDKDKDLSELFEIALTALAFLAFKMFIIHVIMCISMTSNSATTTQAMMMPMSMSPTSMTGMTGGGDMDMDMPGDGGTASGGGGMDMGGGGGGTATGGGDMDMGGGDMGMGDNEGGGDTNMGGGGTGGGDTDMGDGGAATGGGDMDAGGGETDMGDNGGGGDMDIDGGGTDSDMGGAGDMDTGGGMDAGGGSMDGGGGMDMNEGGGITGGGGDGTNDTIVAGNGGMMADTGTGEAVEITAPGSGGDSDTLDFRIRRSAAAPVSSLNELSRRVLTSIEAAIIANEDDGNCLRKILCENNKFSRDLEDNNRILIPIWGLGMSWISGSLTKNINPSTSMLDSLRASILGLGKANCEVIYQSCNLRMKVGEGKNRRRKRRSM